MRKGQRRRRRWLRGLLTADDDWPTQEPKLTRKQQERERELRELERMMRKRQPGVLGSET